jgi:high-affinity K+ transport system ATPase subunit B
MIKLKTIMALSVVRLRQFGIHNLCLSVSVRRLVDSLNTLIPTTVAELFTTWVFG